MQFLHRRPASHLPAAAGAGWSAAVCRVAVVLLAACAACYYCLPLADARDRQLRHGPAADAYPWSGGRPLGIDPWGFVARQCTSYAAWYLNAHGVPFGLRTRGPGGEALFTSAGEWDRAATAAGFAVRSTAAVGSIAQWDPAESSPEAPAAADQVELQYYRLLTAGRYGHVAVVQRVLGDGSVLISEYDGADGRFHLVLTRAPRYLYIGVPHDPSPPRSARTAGSGSAPG